MRDIKLELGDELIQVWIDDYIGVGLTKEEAYHLGLMLINNCRDIP